MSDSNKEKFIYELINSFCDKVKEEVFFIIKKIPINLMEPHVHSVLSALLARQGTLATELCRAVSAWNYHSAPLFIRSMVDVHITIAWLMEEPFDRCLKFVEYGLGQEKLQIEHFKAKLIKEGKDPEENEQIQALENNINAQKYTFLLPVELGSWSGKSTRDMAIECGLQDVYNFSFLSFSRCVHSTWNHISRFNSRPSDSALHRYTFVAEMPEFTPDIHQLDTVARRVDETINLFQRYLSLPEDSQIIDKWLDAKLEELGKKYRSEESR